MRNVLLVLISVVVVSAAEGQVVESVILGDARGATTDQVIRASSMRADKSGFSLLPLYSGTYFNSEHAYGPNLGPVWLGRGFTQAFSGGFRYSSRWVDVQLRPVFVASENRDFFTNEGLYISTDSIPYREIQKRIDAPNRIAHDGYARFYPGETWAKLNLWKFQAGVSSENLWWGPSKRSSLLMSNNAPGFWHLAVNTREPLDLYLFDVEASVIAGFLDPSYAVEDWRGDYRVIINGVVASIRPAFDKNLRLGLIRTFILNENAISDQGGYFPIFQPFLKDRLVPRDDGTPNDPDDQRASVFFSWVFPSIDFHVYGEFARDDHNADLRDLYLQPNHSRAFTLGAQKRWSNSAGYWTYTAEVTHLESVNTKVVRGYEPFYIHSWVNRGYTNVGQYLGSHYGHGGNGMYMSLYRTHEDLTLGVQAERIAVQKDFFHELIAIRKEARPEIQMIFGLHAYKRFERWDVGLELNNVMTSFKYHLGQRPEGQTERVVYNPYNLNVQLHVSWRPDWRWNR